MSKVDFTDSNPRWPLKDKFYEGNKRPHESRIQPTITSGAILQDLVRFQNS